MVGFFDLKSLYINKKTLAFLDKSFRFLKKWLD